ncbi:macro domain-containing protein [Streptomyces sp. NPDC000927]|uniref:macro domain-containing protein n=1 Tax=Streptomyces sp. NPDC000927 TaxID=3154371 RepID=UPI003322C2B4
MAIQIETENIFSSSAHTRIIPVDRTGNMDTGLARQFTARFPGMTSRYWILCQQGNIPLGSVMFDDGDGTHIACMAVQEHPGASVQDEVVDNAMETLARHIKEEGVPSVALPLLDHGLLGVEMAFQ